ncbi:CDK-activating kinase assembly factor MAT1 [Cryptococcus wingfieldii CBS 7118]|uniref:RNA polymerase II transcription factor B subunit 3 n=1 Tax=Cryptococcus wingfieldii CBS 7118 TaxID=1295528 RepID=A0A1E3J8X0_9TREE|nr:CDK-activating kinase assembly factor MAT1 [Cryptococcus wingfieldii CBS 7118]ODN97318.1 CDK-activating kinase assembly factor MAT1 [Cryptococcus wingfieldii CBS 7118]
MSRPVSKKPLLKPSSSNRLGQSSSKLAGPRKIAGGSAGSKGVDEGYLYIAGVKDPSKRVTEYRTEQDICPICHTDRQFNKNLRLLVSPCYHKMCESCVDRLFALGPEKCPVCNRMLRKINFAHQTFEDLKVEKEVSVRRRMSDIFNKRRGDFDSDKEYDDYLEKVEDYTFNLLNDVDVAQTEKYIEDWQRDNRKDIDENKLKTSEEFMTQSKREETDRRVREERMRKMEEAERIEKIEVERIRGEITDALSRGEKRRARDIELKARDAKRLREEALFEYVPPSLLASMIRTDTQHSPLSPSYNGPYVPIPYSDPDHASWVNWYDPQPEYVDRRSRVMFMKEDKEGKVRGGGYDLNLFWEMEVRSAVEAVGVEPLV